MTGILDSPLGNPLQAVLFFREAGEQKSQECQGAWVQILVLPLVSYLTLGKLLNSAMPQFPYL